MPTLTKRKKIGSALDKLVEGAIYVNSRMSRSDGAGMPVINFATTLLKKLTGNGGIEKPELLVKGLIVRVDFVWFYEKFDEHIPGSCYCRVASGYDSIKHGTQQFKLDVFVKTWPVGIPRAHGTIEQGGAIPIWVYRISRSVDLELNDAALFELQA